MNTRLISIALISVIVLAVVSGGGMMTATPATANTTATKVGDLVYLPGEWYPNSVDVGDVYMWDDAGHIHVQLCECRQAG
jgi:hypothetical protein